MKFICLASCFLLALAAAQPQRRFVLMPDGGGKLHLVDLKQTGPHKSINPDKDVALMLYTKSNPTVGQEIKVDDDSTLGHFDHSKPTRIVIHGWTDSGKNMDHFRQAYLWLDVNTIIVDWSGPASALYSDAKESSIEVGVHVGALVKYLESKGADQANINIAGHSLGAHAAGVAGNRAGSKLGKITGMDPAAPLFGSEALYNRLDKSDAKFVEVIHTCAGLLGWEDPDGDVDFYPNGGKIIQPGCGLDLGGACSHARSHHFFTESVVTEVGFRAVQCANWNEYRAGKCDSNTAALMGEFTDTSASGTYYLETASSEPYALG